MAKNKAKMNKFVTGVATAAMVATAVVPVASAAGFNDLGDNVDAGVKADIDKAVTLGFFKEAAKFNPSAQITRGQAALTLARYIAGGDDQVENYAIEHDLESKVTLFNDIPVSYKTGQGFEKELYYASLVVKNAGAFTQLNLNPAGPVTRSQMAKIVTQTFGLEKAEDYVSTITDIDHLDAATKGFIETIASQNVTIVNKFMPAGAVTRSQMASFLVRANDAANPTPEPEITDVKVQSVTAITATTVTVAIEAPTKDIEDATVVVKNTAGQVYATKAVSIKAGATSATFSFETPLTVSPTEGWTVNGVKYVVAELAIANVERLSNTGKFLEVQFNKPLASLEVSELNIRRADTLERVGVEKVTLASDGLSAQITLIGDEATATFVRPLIDYTLSVTQGGKVTSKVFNLDQVVAERLLSTIDAKENSVNGLKLASDIALDLEHALGRTATYWYDKDSFITRINLLDETVKYDALKVDTRSNKDYVTLVTEGKEYLVASDATVIEKTANGLRYVGLVKSVKDADFEYGKVIFNKQGQVQTIVAVEKFTGQLLVEKMNGNLVVANGNELNLKDYTILKDGRTIKASDIKANDVVHYNSAMKFAEVYSKTVTGKISAVYDMKFKVNDEVYTVDAGTQYIKDGKVTTLDQSGIEALEASEKAVTLHFDRVGNLQFVTGELGEVISSTKAAYVTKDATSYDLKATDYISLPVQYDDGTKATEEFTVSSLTEITANGAKLAIDDEVAGTNYSLGTPTTGYKWFVTGFTVDRTNATDFDIKAHFTELDSAGNPAGSPIKKDTVFVNGKTPTAGQGLNKADGIQVVKDDKGAVIGLEVRTLVGLHATVPAVNVIKPGDKVIAATDAKVQIKSSTPVFIENANKTITSTTFGALSSDVNEISAAKIAHDGVDVEYLVLNHATIAGPDAVTSSETVIADVLYDKSANVTLLKVMENGVAKEYTVRTGLKVANLEKGDIVTIDVNKVTGAVDNIVEDNGSSAVLDTTTVKVSEGKFTLNGAREVAASGVKVYEIVKDGSKVTVEERTFSDLANLELDNEVKVSALNGHSTYVDTIVITKNVEPAGSGTPGPTQLVNSDVTALTEGFGSKVVNLTVTSGTFAAGAESLVSVSGLPAGATYGTVTRANNTTLQFTITESGDIDTTANATVTIPAAGVTDSNLDQVLNISVSGVDEVFAATGTLDASLFNLASANYSIVTGSNGDVELTTGAGALKTAVTNLGDFDFVISSTTATLASVTSAKLTKSGADYTFSTTAVAGADGDYLITVTGKPGTKLEGKTQTVKFTVSSNGSVVDLKAVNGTNL